MKRFLLVTMMASIGVFAADKVWTNATGDGKWGTDGNWSDNVAPTASDTGYGLRSACSRPPAPRASWAHLEMFGLIECRFTLQK